LVCFNRNLISTCYHVISTCYHVSSAENRLIERVLFKGMRHGKIMSTVNL